MKSNFRKYAMFNLIVLAAPNLLAASAIMSLRQGEAELAAYCKSGKCPVEIIETDAKEFANGNTFVRFKGEVAQKDIIIVSPKTLSVDQFMELLIKVRTAKSEFAQKVSVVTADNTAELSVVSDAGENILNQKLVNSFLVESGLDGLNGRKIKTEKLPRAGRTSRGIIADAGTNTPLAHSIGRNMSLPVLGLDDAMMQARGEAIRVILVASMADPHNVSFLKTLNQVYEFKKQGVEVTLVTPYLPYARSDKKDQAGVSVIGRLAADMIEKSGADAVSFVRAHAPQSQGFFKIPSIQTMGRKTINTYLKTQGVEQIISPDAGFQKDATLYADDLGLPVSVINKQRDLQTGESKLHDMSGPDVRGKVVAVIDDETASGGTLGKAAEFLKKMGAKKVITVVTHLAGTAKQAVESPYIDAIAVTDTFEVKTQNPKLKVLPIGEELSSDLKKMLGLAPACRKAYTE